MFVHCITVRMMRRDVTFTGNFQEGKRSYKMAGVLYALVVMILYSA
jgi:hypothetical protein